jgi:ferritin-like metal-binding protein YciE
MADKMKSLNDLFQHEIRDLYSAEDQLTKALPQMAEKAKDKNLQDAFTMHLEQTKKQKERLERVATICKFDVKGEQCQAMAGLIKEGKSMLELDANDDVRDAGLIAAAQRVEHYEMAGYGTAKAYARELGLNEVADLLQETLDEEKGANAKLNDLAINRLNARAEK